MPPLAFKGAGRAPGAEKFLVRNLDAVRTDPGLLFVFHTGAPPCAQAQHRGYGEYADRHPRSSCYMLRTRAA